MKKQDKYDVDEFHFYFALRDGDTQVMQEIITCYLAPRTHKALNKNIVMEFNGEFWSDSTQRLDQPHIATKNKPPPKHTSS